VLGEILRRFSPPVSNRLLVGIDGIDDAGVYRLSPDTALVQTVDFFPPIVDDPYAFGQVAAANAISDVYAMGGKPITALNILGFPAAMDPEIIGEILRGGADKIAEADAVIVGGHSVKDDELKYGLAVTGIIDPERIMTNGGARPGDRLILTKPLGTGIVSTAVKRNQASPGEESALIEVMTALNREASDAMMKYRAHAATDITGFGLAGHCYEMATASDVSAEIHFTDIALLPGAVSHAKAGALTGGAGANEQYLEGKIEFDSALDRYARDVVFDAQTSGGLLIAIEEKTADDLIRELADREVTAFAIGRVVPKEDIVISVT
jgi:selenide,water dikinase